MPPFSKSLADEGAAIRTFKLVEKGNALHVHCDVRGGRTHCGRRGSCSHARAGRFNEEGITAILTSKDDPSRQGSRNLSDNLSDLRAQVRGVRVSLTPALMLCSHQRSLCAGGRQPKGHPAHGRWVSSGHRRRA